MANLSIILVNWNCIAFTEQCIESIRSAGAGIDYEVIVVDNASADSPCQTLLDRFPWIQLIHSPENIGFGQANNLGVRHSSGEILFFLNPDTLVIGDALHRMLHTADAVPQVGAIGCRLLNRDRTLQTSSVQRFPTVSNQILALGWLQRRWPNLPLWGKQALYHKGSLAIHEVDVVSGAALMVRRSVFEAAGRFNPEYFMYAEEVDLCFAIHRAGWKVLHRSDAQIVHFGGQSTRQRENGFVDITMRDSVYRFLLRTRGTNYAVLYRFCLLLSAILRITTLACASPFLSLAGSPDRRQAAAGALSKWRRIARWSMGMESDVERAVPQAAVNSPSAGD